MPASLGALEGGYVVFFEAFGLGATAGLSYVLVRRLREITWAVVGFLALGAEPPARPRSAAGAGTRVLDSVGLTRRRMSR